MVLRFALCALVLLGPSVAGCEPQAEGTFVSDPRDSGGKPDDGMTDGGVKDDDNCPLPQPDGSCPATPVCTATPAPTEIDIHVSVPHGGPYGTHSFSVPARANWVNSGLYLRAGETATIAVDGGTWSANGITSYGAAGDASGQPERGCPYGALAARVGLSYEDAITCVTGASATVTATKDGPVFVGMSLSTDLGEFYHSRKDASGSLNVTVTSTANTFPVVTRGEAPCTTLTDIASGHLEFAGKHVSVIVPVAALQRDASTAIAALDTLDAIYESHTALRGATPYFGQRIRFVRDAGIEGIGYMLAGNPIRMVGELEDGADNHRILRSGVDTTDVWGFAHELGHTFTVVNAMWVYMYLNLESWPNIFTLYTLNALGRTAHQPNVATYCDGKTAYLAAPNYTLLRSDAFVQLCFLMQFTDKFGYDMWKVFFSALNGATNEDVAWDGTDASIWRFAKNFISSSAGEDVTPIFNAWQVPLN
jgi:hypothetical protein